MIGWALRQLILWGGAAFLLIAIVDHRAAFLPEHSRAAVPASAPASRQAAENRLVYFANPQGHVVVDAVVNGTPIKMLVDTGATVVTLTPQDARAAGFDINELDFDQRFATANGATRAAPVRLRELRLDQLSLDDIPAAVVENLNISLLGMSFLDRLRSYEMRGGKLIITW